MTLSLNANKNFPIYSGWIIIWLTYFIYVYFYSSVAPLMDDYDFYLGSLIEFNKANGFYEKMVTIFAQHNEHRPVIPRSIALVLTKLWIGWNFKILILIGNLSLLITWIFLIKNITVKNFWLRSIISTAILFTLIGLQSAENIFWATGALQNYSTILFCVLSIHFANKHKIIIGVIFALCAVLCSMTGFLLFPFLLFFIFRDKKWIYFSLIFVIMLIVGLGYFWNYKKPMHSIIFANSIHDNLPTKFKYFFVFIGSCFSLKNNTNITITFWGGILLCVLFVFQNINYKKWDFWTYLGFFVILNSVAASNGRSMMGLEQGLSERYRLISELFFITCSLKTLNWFHTKRFLTSSAFAFVCILSFSVQFFYRHPHVVAQKKLLDTGLALFVTKMDPVLLVYPIPAMAGITLMESHTRRIYSPVP